MSNIVYFQQLKLWANNVAQRKFDIIDRPFRLELEDGSEIDMEGFIITNKGITDHFYSTHVFYDHIDYTVEVFSCGVGWMLDTSIPAFQQVKIFQDSILDGFLEKLSQCKTLEDSIAMIEEHGI